MLLEILSGNVATVVEVGTPQTIPGLPVFRMGSVDTAPGMAGMFLQTGLGEDGEDFTIWIEDGL